MDKLFSVWMEFIFWFYMSLPFVFSFFMVKFAHQRDAAERSLRNAEERIRRMMQNE